MVTLIISTKMSTKWQIQEGSDLLKFEFKSNFKRSLPLWGTSQTHCIGGESHTLSGSKLWNRWFY